MVARHQITERIIIYCTREEYSEEKCQEVLKRLGFKLDTAREYNGGTRYEVVGVRHSEAESLFDPQRDDMQKWEDILR